MRNRLLAALLAIAALFLFAFGVRIGLSSAEAQQRQMYLDRLNDTARLASLAGSALDADDPSGVRADFDRLAQVYGIHSALLDQSGTVIAASDPPPDLNSAQVRAAIASAAAGIREGDPRVILPWNDADLVVAEPVDLNGDVIGVVVTSSPTDRLHHSVLRAWGLLALAGLLMLAALGAASLWFTRWILGPVRALDDSAHLLATGRLDARVARSTGPPELRRLAVSFNEMAGTVQTALEQQRAFVADASHQLRNPLNALLLRLQYLQVAAQDELPEALREAEEEGWRLTRLVDDLLSLATAPSADQAAPPVFDVQDIVRERVEAWAAAAQDNDLTLSIEPRSDTVADDDVLRAAAHPTALRRALDEALSNAIKYTPPHGHIGVAMAAFSDEVRVEVRDDGPGLSAEELDLAMNRFWRSPAHQNVDGFGLGLSIAQALLASVGGRLECESGAAGGLTVRLRLPRASTSATVSAPQMRPVADEPVPQA